MKNRLLAAMTAVVFAAALTLSPTHAQIGVYTPTAPSGALTLTAGGTPQTLFKAGEVTRGLVIQNPPTATENIRVDFVKSASSTDGNTSIVLTPGQSVGFFGSLASAVSWVAATTGHAINAYQY